MPRRDRGSPTPIRQLPAAPDLLVRDLTVLGLTGPPVLHPVAVRGRDLPQPHLVLLCRRDQVHGQHDQPELDHAGPQGPLASGFYLHRSGCASAELINHRRAPGSKSTPGRRSRTRAVDGPAFSPGGGRASQSRSIVKRLLPGAIVAAWT